MGADPKSEELAAEFAGADMANWRNAAKISGDDDLAARKLARTTLDGVSRGPLHARENTPDRTQALNMRPRAGALDAWIIAASIRQGGPSAVNDAALDELAGGVARLELHIDPAGEFGATIGALDELDEALSGVALEAVALSLHGAAPAANAALLAALWEKRDVSAEQRAGAINFDASGGAASGASAEDAAASRKIAIDWADWARTHAPSVSVFCADGRIVHEAGGGAALELGWAAASAAGALLALIEAGAWPDEAAAQIEIALASDADIHQSIAKLRAMRMIWSRLSTALGAENARVKIIAHGSARMLTRRDPWTNMLRLTNAGFAAAVAGADAICLPAFTDALGAPTHFARRIARNVQNLIMEESHAGATADPAAGGYHHEAMSDALARAGWAVMQDIAKAGGDIAFAASGALKQKAEAERARLEANVSKRRAPVLGVSIYAPHDPRPARTADAAEITPSPRADAGEAPGGQSPDDLVKAARQGAGPHKLGASGTRNGGHALAPMRLAAPFEALQDAADAFADKTGARPRAFIVRLGEKREIAGAFDKLSGLLAAGGVEAHLSETDAPGAAADEAQAENARLAIIVAAPDTDGSDISAMAQALEKTGATVWLQRAHGGAPDLAAMDSFGDDAALLSEVHVELGVDA